MALFIAPTRHRFDRTEWRSGSKIISLEEPSEIFAELLFLQQEHELQKLDLMDGFGNYVYAICKKGFGRWPTPEYREYRILNKAGACVMIINGLVLFNPKKYLLQTCVCIKYCDQIVKGTGTYHGDACQLIFDWSETTVDLDWRDGSGSTPSESYVSGKDVPSLEIYGPGPLHMQQGASPIYKVCRNNKKAFFVYSYGKWFFSPKSWVERYFFDKIVIVEFTSSFRDVISCERNAMPAVISAVCGPLFAARPTEPYINS